MQNHQWAKQKRNEKKTINFYLPIFVTSQGRTTVSLSVTLKTWLDVKNCGSDEGSTFTVACQDPAKTITYQNSEHLLLTAGV